MPKPFKEKLYLDSGESYPAELVELHRLIEQRLIRKNPGIPGRTVTADCDRPCLRLIWEITPTRWPALCFTGPYAPDSEYGVWCAELRDYILPEPAT